MQDLKLQLHHAIKIWRGSGSVAPCILNLITGCRCAFKRNPGTHWI